MRRRPPSHEQNRFDVTVKDLWDGTGEVPKDAAVVCLRFLDSDFSVLSLSEQDKDQLFQELAPDVQASVDATFGVGVFGLRNVGVEVGSLEVLVALVVLAPWNFLIHYDKVQKNLPVLIELLKTHGPKLIDAAHNVWARVRARVKAHQSNPPHSS